MDFDKRREITAALSKPFPKEAVQQRIGGGGKMLDYVSGTTVRHRLDDVLGNQYDFLVTDVEWHPWGEDKSKQPQWLVIVHGVMTIEGLGQRSGIGVQIVNMRSEDLIKGAKTDALKNAAMEFGVGRELYGENLEAKAAQAARPTPKKRLSELLKTHGVATPTAAEKAAKEKFGKALKELDADEIDAWVKELELEEKAPF